MLLTGVPPSFYFRARREWASIAIFGLARRLSRIFLAHAHNSERDYRQDENEQSHIKMPSAGLRSVRCLLP